VDKPPVLAIPTAYLDLGGEVPERFQRLPCALRYSFFKLLEEVLIYLAILGHHPGRRMKARFKVIQSCALYAINDNIQRIGRPGKDRTNAQQSKQEEPR
jgi:hypothetical protein